MRVAVYTIALNEEQFVQRWHDSAKDADYLLIADTGSQDSTIKLAKSLGINVVPISVKPWRFDDARNAALSLLPDDIDICISLDMDEVLVGNWRKTLESIDTKTTRPRYQYTWNFINEKPGLRFGGDHIHSRHGYRWKYPVHEVIVPDRIIEVQEWIDLEIHHKADQNKSRSQYLDLLKLATKEDKLDSRSCYYYARELFFQGSYVEATKEFSRYLNLPTSTWSPERSSAYRYMAKCNPTMIEQYLQKAISEDSNRREPLVEIAKFYYEKQEWGFAYEYSIRALSIETPQLDFLAEEFAWGSLPFDIASISAWNLGLVEQALFYAQKALELDPSNSRIQENLKFYQTYLDKTATS